MNAPISIGSRWEIFADDLLIDELDGVHLRMHEPRLMPRPQCGLPSAYATIIKDQGVYRGYYRDYLAGSEYENALPRDRTAIANGGVPEEERAKKVAAEITCYAESGDGHEWTFPDLGLVEARSPRGGNVILAGATPCCHNFTPFLDARGDVPAHERYKALCGTHTCGGGLHALVSADGRRWRRLQEEPVFSSQKLVELSGNQNCPGLDSQNPAFWSEAEQCYVCYMRVNIMREKGPLRAISRITSADFRHWSDPVIMETPLPEQQLYTSGTHPYFRSPHIYIALPTRFLWERESSTDILFMSTRAGSLRYERLFDEAFLRPGLDAGGWKNRANYAALNVVPTSATEMSIYNCGNHWGDRYTLRIDGFTSLHAGAHTGKFTTVPLTFSGDKLRINYSTSAAGNVRVEIQELDGTPIPGFAMEDCEMLIGDSIEQQVFWKNHIGASCLAGKPVRLRFELQEADLYGWGFSDIDS